MNQNLNFRQNKILLTRKNKVQKTNINNIKDKFFNNSINALEDIFLLISKNSIIENIPKIIKANDKKILY